jgi:serine/threonine-protein kinase
MPFTTQYTINATEAVDGSRPRRPPAELMRNYGDLLKKGRMAWTAHPSLMRMLGRGGQGVVFLSERRGADEFTVPMALKIFSPERYEDVRSYAADMSRIARVASLVAQIQHENLLNVTDFYDRDQIRVMAMEWVDGYDFRALLSNELLQRIYHRVSLHRWENLNNIVITEGEVQPQIKPGVAVAIVRDCLGALAALHRAEVVHGDIKPSNIMLKRTGHAKIIDFGSAFELNDPPPVRTCTPVYAAPEVLEGTMPTKRSDLASLGYVLIELLAGKPVFNHMRSYGELIAKKRDLHQRLDEFLPEEVAINPLLMNFCRKLIAPDPTARFPNAEIAELVEGGAAAFHRQLVMSDMASEYDNDIRVFLNEVKELAEIDADSDTNSQWPA